MSKVHQPTEESVNNPRKGHHHSPRHHWIVDQLNKRFRALLSRNSSQSILDCTSTHPLLRTLLSQNKQKNYLLQFHGTQNNHSSTHCIPLRINIDQMCYNFHDKSKQMVHPLTLHSKIWQDHTQSMYEHIPLPCLKLVDQENKCDS
ncbi:hypothetical protein D3C80_1617350 [compost metagenome]